MKLSEFIDILFSRFKKPIIVTSYQEKVNVNNNPNRKKIIIPSKIYDENMEKIKKLNISSIEKIKDLIEKLACWYELVYPNYQVYIEIDNYSDIKTVDELMFSIITNIANLEGSVADFKWSEVFGIDTFLRVLSSSESCYLATPKYSDLCFIGGAHVHIDENGYIKDSEELSWMHSNVKLDYINIKNASKYAKRLSDNHQNALKELGAITYDLIVEKSILENWTSEDFNRYLLFNRSVIDSIRILRENNYDEDKINKYESIIDEVKTYYAVRGMHFFFEDGQFNGMHVKELYEFLKKAEVDEEQLKRLKNLIDSYELEVRQRELILDTTLYRIIERGGIRVGPRRGLLFARDFNRNIDIPMMYAYDSSDPRLRSFLNMYIKLGGDMDLEIYDEFPWSKPFTFINETISIRDLLKNEKYTMEELELIAKMAGILKDSIDPQQLDYEKIKQRRIDRKIQ